jgi:hypothetical protein
MRLQPISGGAPGQCGIRVVESTLSVLFRVAFESIGGDSLPRETLHKACGQMPLDFWR